jgi:hypothetical protein
MAAVSTGEVAENTVLREVWNAALRALVLVILTVPSTRLKCDPIWIPVVRTFPNDGRLAQPLIDHQIRG